MTPQATGGDKFAHLANYLAAAGFTAEAKLARRAADSIEDRQKLEQTLHKIKPQLPLSPRLIEMEQLLTTLFGSSADLIFHHLRLGTAQTAALLVNVAGVVNTDLLQRTLEGLLNNPATSGAPADPEQLPDWLVRNQVTVPRVLIESQLAKLISAALNGQAIILIEGATRAIRLAVPGGKRRSVEEAKTEGVVRGPREGFVEDILTNVALLRQRIRDDRFRVEYMEVGEVTSTQVGLLHLSGICKQSYVDEAKSRLSRIKTDGILESAYIEEFIEDTPWTVFPLLRATERPDAVAAALLEGRFTILVDGSPFALIAPTFFVDMMQSAEDYYDRFPSIFFLRGLRWFLAMVSLVGPALYVALTTFHTAMIPTQLLLSIMAGREGVPFPALIEALIMEIAFETLREATIRMPKQVGQTIGIVGALVIGQAAVQAGVVSPIMIIVVSITGIASFVVPKYSAAVSLRLLRFPLLFLSSVLGILGLIFGLLLILTHLLTLRSFGAPYAAPFGPLLPVDRGDVLMRTPHWNNRTRPTNSETPNPVRTGKGLQPGPHHRGEEERP